MRKVLARIGDVDPTAYGGGFVFQEKDNHGYSQWIEYTHGAEDEPGMPLTLYLVHIPDNVGEWFDWVDWKAVAKSVGTPYEYMNDLLESHSVLDRAMLIELAASYHGWDQFDNYPEQYTEGQLNRRWRSAYGRPRR